MNWKKILKIVDRYILFLVILNILGILLSFVLSDLILTILLMVPFIITFHAGYAVEKKLKKHGSMGGAITLASAFFINTIMLSILYWIGALQFIADVFTAPGSSEVIVLAPKTNIILLFLDIGIGLVIGFILGGLGGFTAKKLK